MDAARGTVEDTSDPTLAGRRSPPIAFEDLGVPSIFSGYAAGDPLALGFFAGDPRSPGDRRAAASRAGAHPRDRGTLADVLLEQNAGWAAPEERSAGSVRAGVDALRDPESVAVVTGQQLGLFGGPLYTLHKALTAVAVARRLADETGRPAVPVFWLADEDHDFAEVRTAAYAAADGVVRVEYEDGFPADANRGAVGRIVIEDDILRVLDELESGLPGGPFTPALVATLRTAWRPGARWRDAFARTLRLLLPDAPLVLMSADDRRLKELASGILREEATGWKKSHDAHSSATDALTAAGFGVQVPPRPLHLFLLDEGHRRALDPVEDAEGAVVIRATGEHLPADELVRAAAFEPERLSPDVVLRPVVEDALLPTATYVAGPGEIAYFAQLKGVYDRFALPMPLVAPRASLTLVEPAIRRVIERLGLEVADLRGDPTALLTRIALARDAPALEATLAGAELDVERALAAASAAVVDLDTSLAAAAAAALARTRRALNDLRRKTERVARRRHEDDAARLVRARAALFPDGGLQERLLSALGFYTRYGPDLGRLVEEAIDLDEPGHLIVDLP